MKTETKQQKQARGIVRACRKFARDTAKDDAAAVKRRSEAARELGAAGVGACKRRGPEHYARISPVGVAARLAKAARAEAARGETK